MLDEELVEKICKLGLTTRQAKIYLCIVTSGTPTIAEISEKTGLHQQDIYRIISKLEKKGLAIRTISDPIRAEIIPLKKGLGNLIKMQQQQIENQKNNAQEIIEVLEKRRQPFLQKEEGKFAIMPSGEAQKNRLDLLFENVKMSYDLFMTKERCVRRITGLVDDVFPRIAKHRVKIRILIETPLESNLIEMIKKLKWPAIDVTIKSTDYNSQINYAIVDDELWFPLEETNDLLGKILVTDCRPVVHLARENFNKFWGENNTRILFQQERNKILPKRKRTDRSTVQPQNVTIG